MRVNINIDEELLQKIDSVAKKNYVSRSAYISLVLSQKIQADEVAQAIPVLTDTYKKALAKTDHAQLSLE